MTLLPVWKLLWKQYWGVCFCAAAEQRRLPSGWLKRHLAITQTAEQRLVKMAARRVVVAAVAQAVSELQSSQADSNQHLNQMLTHLTECCRSLSSATNTAEHLADDLRSGTSIKHRRHCAVVWTVRVSSALSYGTCMLWDVGLLRGHPIHPHTDRARGSL